MIERLYANWDIVRDSLTKALDVDDRDEFCNKMEQLKPVACNMFILTIKQLYYNGEYAKAISLAHATMKLVDDIHSIAELTNYIIKCKLKLSAAQVSVDELNKFRNMIKVLPVNYLHVNCLFTLSRGYLNKSMYYETLTALRSACDMDEVYGGMNIQRRFKYTVSVVEKILADVSGTISDTQLCILIECYNMIHSMVLTGFVPDNMIKYYNDVIRGAQDVNIREDISVYLLSDADIVDTVSD